MTRVPEQGRYQVPDEHSPAWLPWTVLTVGVLGLLGLYVVFVLTTTGQALDNRVAGRLTVPEGWRGEFRRWHRLAIPASVLVGGLAMLWSLVRGWRTPLSVLAAGGICYVLPQALKAGLPRPQLADPWQMSNSLPSGHVAAVAAAGVALLLVVPRSWRPAALIVATMATLAMGVLVVGLEHHRVSDVAASVAVAMTAWGTGALVRGEDPPVRQEWA